MRHYVLTRSSYGPEWDVWANRRRLNVTRAVTARLMGRQSTNDWTWVVLFDERDPLLGERMDLFEEANPNFIPIVWLPYGQPENGVLYKRTEVADHCVMRAPWLQAIGPQDGFRLTTRLDDDDGLAVDAIERYQDAAMGLVDRTALMLPNGIRVWQGRFSLISHPRNAMHTLLAPPGDSTIVYDYSHVRVAEIAPVVTVDTKPGWLWVRHKDTISGGHYGERSITPAVRDLFPVDWAVLEGSWRS